MINKKFLLILLIFQLNSFAESNLKPSDNITAYETHIEKGEIKKFKIQTLIQKIKDNPKKIILITILLISAALIYKGKHFWKKQKKKWKRKGANAAIHTLWKEGEILKKTSQIEKKAVLGLTQETEENAKFIEDSLITFLVHAINLNPNSLSTLDRIASREAIKTDPNKKTKYTFVIRGFDSPAATQEQWRRAIETIKPASKN